MCVFLPASYLKQKSRRYPVPYALHGYSIGAEQWTHEIPVPKTIESAFAPGGKEMIVVLPDSKTAHEGSMYSSSVTTGDFGQSIADDVVAYIDAHYRTLPNGEGRGLRAFSDELGLIFCMRCGLSGASSGLPFFCGIVLLLDLLFILTSCNLVPGNEK